MSERNEWYVRAGSDGSNGVLLLGDLISSTFDEFVPDVVYGVTGLSQFDPSGLATIKYVDEQDAGLQGVDRREGRQVWRHQQQDGRQASTWVAITLLVLLTPKVTITL